MKNKNFKLIISILICVLFTSSCSRIYRVNPGNNYENNILDEKIEIIDKTLNDFNILEGLEKDDPAFVENNNAASGSTDDEKTASEEIDEVNPEIPAGSDANAEAETTPTPKKVFRPEEIVFYRTCSLDAIPAVTDKERFYAVERATGDAIECLYISSDTSILEIDPNGDMHAKKPGTVDIHISVGSLNYTLSFTVANSIYYAFTSGDVTGLSESDNAVLEEINKVIDNYNMYHLTTFEQIRTVHNYILQNTEYDTGRLENGSFLPDSYTVKGVLLNKKAVCEGYAQAFALFMNLLGIENQIVRGTTLKNNATHAWNLVKLEDDWYHIDVTWDDPIGNPADKINYTYFMLPDAFIQRTHAFNPFYPACTSTAYTYEVYADNIIDSIDQFEDKFYYFYSKGCDRIMILYPEHELPDFSLIRNHYKGAFSYYPLSVFGDYSVFEMILRR